MAPGEGEVELLFHTLKNGCRVEALKLDSYAKLERAIALYLVVAWGIGLLLRLVRTHPELDAGIAFEPDEIRVAYALHGKRPPPKPKVNQVLRLIAMLGGFIVSVAPVRNPRPRSPRTPSHA